MALERTGSAGENPLPCGIPATVGEKQPCITSATVTKLLLTIHVLAAIIAIGPVTVAASMFPAATRHATADPADPRGVAILRNLHRICRVYAALGVLVPVFGLATASSLGVLTDAWLITSMALTVLAAGVLVLLVLPGQAAILTALPTEPAAIPPAASAGKAGLRSRASGAEREMAETRGRSGSANREVAEFGRAGRAGGMSGEDGSVGTGSGSADLVGDPSLTAADTARSAATSTDFADVRPRAGAERRLGMVTGIFNLLWAIVVVLMIVRPGSTTGA
jgi:hypothetical protein